jgi:drug/metabolite transporter (DMT)-like permease
VALRDRPVLAAAAGAACIASSATLVSLAATAPATAATFRCVYALPFLGVLMVLEDRRLGRRPRRARLLAAAAGVFFAVDLVLWHHAIAAVGAGIATVLGNLQVVIVGFIAWWLLGERPSRRLIAAVPIVLVGVVLISGVVGQGAYGDNPMLGVVFGAGTSIAYAGFLLVLREGSMDLRRAAGPLFDATAVAAVVCIALGPASGGIDLVPSWPAHGWLVTLAITSQVAGWLLIAISLPRLPAALTSVVLLLQPVASVALAAAVLDERPSVVQLTGCFVVLAGVVAATASRRGSTPSADLDQESDFVSGPAGSGGRQQRGDGGIDVEVHDLFAGRADRITATEEVGQVTRRRLQQGLAVGGRQADEDDLGAGAP